MRRPPHRSALPLLRLAALAAVVTAACAAACSSTSSDAPVEPAPDAGTKPPGTSTAQPPDVPFDAGSTPRPDAQADSGTKTDASVDAGAQVDAGPLVARPSIFAGARHTCAILADGSVKCWGANDEGQLGLGDVADRGSTAGQMGAALPTVDLGPGRTAVSLALGSSHTCALLDDGNVKCWGANDEGQLGLDDGDARGDAAGEMGATLPAVALGAGRTALAIAAGATHTCAVLDNGALLCWGANDYGQLFTGDNVRRGKNAGDMAALTPVSLPPGRTARAVSASFQSTCALLDDGQVRCLGFNITGQLGIGNNSTRGASPAHVGAGLLAADLGPGLTALQVAIGNNHTCARLGGGKLKCWGDNLFGQLGLGDTVRRGDEPNEMGAALPLVDLGASVERVAVGNRFTCAVVTGGRVKCWGNNGGGRLGLGDTVTRGKLAADMGAGLPSVDLGPGRTAVDVTVGSAHACARLDDGAIKCWGENDRGQLGLGDARARGGAPTDMGAALPAVSVGP
jgi:alpha-tubulin suppressor-like RCC1 family protein